MTYSFVLFHNYLDNFCDRSCFVVLCLCCCNFYFDLICALLGLLGNLDFACLLVDRQLL